jgi:hypothetical protein
MNLRVQYADGRVTTLVLRGSLAVVHGQELDRIVGEDMEYFFTKDGFYDGWGGERRVGKAEANPPHTMNQERRIED